MSNKVNFSIYRYNPETNNKAYYKDYEVELGEHDANLLNALVSIVTDSRITGDSRFNRRYDAIF